jgi:enoyl-CoA hydratase/carnithine racemase
VFTSVLIRNMPHELLAMRLRTLWGVNEGTAAGRLMRLIPDDGALAAEGRRVVAAVALENGLVGEARRLIDEIDPAMRDAAAWRLVARLAAEGEAPDGAAENDALREAGEAPRPPRWQCTSCQLVHEAWQPHCVGCAGFATLEWRSPDGITPLISSADETD